MITATYKAADLFVVRLATCLVGNPAWANLKIDSNRSLHRDDARGAGLYAIHFQGRLLYVGKFLGTKADPFGGNVCFTRWAKHLGTLTLRDRRISFSRKPVDDMRRRHPLIPPLADIMAASELPVIIKPRGRVSSLNRALFAAENWATLSQLTDAQGLADFTIIYTRVEAGDTHSPAELRSAIGAAERAVIALARPRCNSQIPEGTAGEMSLEDTGRILETELAASLAHPTGAPDALAPAEVALEPVEAEAPDDTADPTAEEAFLERIDGDEHALLAVASIEEAFDAIDDAYVEYTKTQGGDLRIRSLIGPRAFFNVAAIGWQRKLHQFSVEINLTVERCLDLGASTASLKYPDKTLGTRATFSMPETMGCLVRCLVAAAAQQ